MSHPEPALLDKEGQAALAKRCQILFGPLGPVEAKRMFGSHGLFLEGRMFALIAATGLFFKVDAESQSLFETAGGSAFNYSRQGQRVSLSYWAPPHSDLEDPETLKTWATRAIEAARRAKTKKKKRR